MIINCIFNKYISFKNIEPPRFNRGPRIVCEHNPKELLLELNS